MKLVQLFLAKLLAGLVILITIFGCATTPTGQSGISDNGLFLHVEPGSNITMIPIDVELSLLTASGMLEPKAEWTETAHDLMNAEIERVLVAAGYTVSEAASLDEDLNLDYAQIQKLNETVGFTIALHHYGGQPLPSKQGRLQWSIGESAEYLKGADDSHYALYIFFRDSYTSAGRVAMQILSAALLGIAPAGGQQVGFAQLVDTSKGDVVWFSHLVSGVGDARNEKGVTATVNRLLGAFPGVVQN